MKYFIVVLMVLGLLVACESSQESKDCVNAKTAYQAALLAEQFLCAETTPAVPADREFNIDKCKASKLATAAAKIIMDNLCAK